MRVLKISKEIELFVGGLGAVQSLFLGTYIFFGKKRSTTNWLLAGFFILITLRIIKSTLWIYVDSLPEWIMNLGFMAHCSAGPILFLYLRHFLFPRKWNPFEFIHFIPAVIIILLLFRINLDNFWYLGGYKVLLYQQILYLLASSVIIVIAYSRKNELPTTITRKDWIWLGILFLGAAIIQLAYFANYALGLTPYLAGPIVYGIFIYPITFFAVLNPDVFRDTFDTIKYQNINMSSQQFEYAKRKIIQVMDDEKPFLNDSFTLKQLSHRISLPVYLTSHVVNKGFHTNFSDFINSRRIDEAKYKLGSSAYQNIKISELAHQCGFNSVSSFNVAFKKHTGTTPSRFKKNIDL